jgi:hypothetical protein
MSPFQGLALRRRIADAVEVMGRRKLLVAVMLVSVAGIALLAARTGTEVFSAAATPDWRFL